MSNHVLLTIGDLKKKIQTDEENIVRLKKTINDLCGIAGIPAEYQSDDLIVNVAQTAEIRPDLFHARPLATVIREFLEMRKARNIGPATTNEIYTALTKGGYEFGSKNEGNAMIVLNQAIRKNSVFYRLPNNTVGLTEWYPGAKKKKSTGADDVASGDEASAGEEEKKI
ncbi:MAG: hypothetical protein WC047_06490 [Kiritimatiellales bacterium]